MWIISNILITISFVQLSQKNPTTNNQTYKMVEETSLYNTNSTDASDSRVPTKNSKFNNGTSVPSTKQKNRKWGTLRNKNYNLTPTALSFKGANVDLCGKVFVKSPLQAAKYNKAYNDLLNYIGSTYDHRVYTAFGYTDRSKRVNLLNKL